MGCIKNIAFDKFPKQKKEDGLFYIGQRVKVIYHYDTTKFHFGTIVRNDIEEPFETIIKLDNGRYLRDVECQLQPWEDENLLAHGVSVKNEPSPETTLEVLQDIKDKFFRKNPIVSKHIESAKNAVRKQIYKDLTLIKANGYYGCCNCGSLISSGSNYCGICGQATTMEYEKAKKAGVENV